MRTLIGGLLLLCVGWTATPSAAQGEADSSRLQHLLQELKSLSPEAWKARLAELEKDIAARRTRAGQLREQAKKLLEQAEREEAAADAVAAHVQLLRDLQKLLAGLPVTTRPEKPRPEKKPPAVEKAERSDAMKAGERVDLPEYVAYDEHLRDLLDESCSVCHDSDEASGGLDVTSFAALRQGGGSGKTIVPGRPEQSRMYRMLTGQERPFMPKDTDPLSRAQLDLVRRWIEQGAAEDVVGARAFVEQRMAERAGASAAAPVSPSLPVDTPMPADLPDEPLRTAERSPPVKCMAKSAVAPLLAFPGMGQVVLLGEDSEALGVLPCPLEEIEALGFSEDGAWLLAAGATPGRRGRAVLCDVRTGKALGEFAGGRDTVLAAAVHRGQRLVALGGPDKEVLVFSADSGEEVYKVPAHEDWVLSSAFSPSGDLLATADRAGALHLWETQRGRNVHTLRGHVGAVHAVAFASERLLASVGADGTLRGWDLDEGEERWRKNAHRGEALALCVGARILGTGGSDGRVRAWKLDGSALGSSGDVGDWVYAVVSSSAGDVLWAGDWAGRLHRFELEAKKVTAVATPLEPRS